MEDLNLPYDSLLFKFPELGVRAGADLLWLKLTGQTKANSNVSKPWAIRGVLTVSIDRRSSFSTVVCSS